MKIIVEPNHEQLSQIAAEIILNSLENSIKTKGKFILGCATGSTPKLTYKIFLELIAKSSIPLENFYTFNLDEYVGVTQDSPNSYYQEMLQQLWLPLEKLNRGFTVARNAHILNCNVTDYAAECARYEAEIKELGGIDLQILGIGTNGHIAFNEPGSTIDSRTRIVDLATETIAVNAQKFFAGDINQVPKQALTTGIGTILEARELLLLISGESKREILNRLLSGEAASSENPASFLLGHTGLTIVHDLGRS